MENSELKQLADRVGRSTDRLVNTGNRLINTIDQSNKMQEKHNRAIVWLTGVIAFATVVYATVTLWAIIVQ